MTIRTIRQTVTFAKPFTLANWDEAQPAGTYEIEIDEELLDGFPFSAYRRVQTLLHLHPTRRNPGLRQTILISAGEQEAALQRPGARTRRSRPDAGPPKDAEWGSEGRLGGR